MSASARCTAGGDAQRVEALLLDSIAAPEDAKRLAAAHWAAQVRQAVPDCVL